MAVGGLALVALVLAGVLVASSLGGAPPRSLIAPDSVGAISPSRGAVSSDVPVASSPSAMASGAGALWVSNYNAGTVSRIDPTTRALVQTISAGQTPSGIAVGAGAVWVANYIVGTVSRIAPTVNRVVQRIPVGNGPSGVAVGFGSVWVTNSSDGTLTRIDAVTGVPAKPIAVGGDPTGVTVGFGAAWVSDAADSRLLEIDPSTNQVTQSIDVGTGPGALAVGYGSVWVANTLDGTVSRINPQTNQVAATIQVGNTPTALATGAGGVWVANEFGNSATSSRGPNGSVARIDPATDSPPRTIAVADPPTALAISNGLLWAGVRASTAVHRGGTLIVLQNAPFGSLDPYGPGSIAAFLTQVVTTDGLTAFKRVGGSDGDEVVPDLAVSLPTPTDGGRTYTFRLRTGVRYSNGEPVRPEDFRRAAQRALMAGDNFDFENLIGASTCAARPSHCDLSQSIVTDDAYGTVTFHLATPDPDFRSKLAQPDAAAVAPGTSFHDINAHSLPATGPYKVVSVTRRQVVLARNPYFHEWSHAAQPNGYPDRIVWQTGGSVKTAITEVERGEADYTLDPPPPASLSAIETRLPSQLHVTLDDVTIQLALNTRAAPFNDVRVRRALSYAVNRTTVARLLGQDSQPTCQWLPPDALGYEPYCPYTLNPVDAGTWSAPDLNAARRLIAASGTRGTPITIWSGPGYSTPDFTPAARYLASVLNQLGYPTRVTTFNAQDNLYQQVTKPDSKFQAFDRVDVPTFPAPSQFLGPDFTGCSGSYNFYEFCDPETDATVRAALAAQANESPAAPRFGRTLTERSPTKRPP